MSWSKWSVFPWLASLALCGPVYADCGPWPEGVRVRTIGAKPLALSGDFNGDGRVDRLEFLTLAADAMLPPDIPMANPWDRQPARSGTGELVALGISHGARADKECRRQILANPGFFSAPLWSPYLAGDDQGPPPWSLVQRGTRAHRHWQARVKALRGDGLALGTEAGIDILLYWQGQGYRVFWPPEEP